MVAEWPPELFVYGLPCTKAPKQLPFYLDPRYRAVKAAYPILQRFYLKCEKGLGKITFRSERDLEEAISQKPSPWECTIDGVKYLVSATRQLRTIGVATINADFHDWDVRELLTQIAVADKPFVILVRRPNKINLYFKEGTEADYEKVKVDFSRIEIGGTKFTFEFVDEVNSLLRKPAPVAQQLQDQEWNQNSVSTACDAVNQQDTLLQATQNSAGSSQNHSGDDASSQIRNWATIARDTWGSSFQAPSLANNNGAVNAGSSSQTQSNLANNTQEIDGWKSKGAQHAGYLEKKEHNKPGETPAAQADSVAKMNLRIEELELENRNLALELEEYRSHVAGLTDQIQQFKTRISALIAQKDGEVAEKHQLEGRCKLITQLYNDRMQSISEEAASLARYQKAALELRAGLLRCLTMIPTDASPPHTEASQSASYIAPQQAYIPAPMAAAPYSTHLQIEAAPSEGSR